MPTLRPLLKSRPDLQALHADLKQGLLELLCCDRPWHASPKTGRAGPEAKMRVLLARYSLTVRAETARTILKRLRTTGP